MLKEKRRLFEALFTVADVLTVSLAWCLAYWIRFESGWFILDKGRPEFLDYVSVLVLLAPIWALTFRMVGLYKPMRGVREWRERLLLVYGNLLSIGILITAIFLFREKTTPFSRAVFIWFGALALLFTMVERGFLRFLLRDIRRKGYNLRYMIVVGEGQNAAELINRIRQQRELGIQLLGCVTERGSSLGISGVPIIGSYLQLGKLLGQLELDQVLIALPIEHSHYLPQVVTQIADSLVDIKIVPDLYRFVRLGGSIEEFEGLPVVGIQSSPLEGLGRVFKRLFDIIISFTLLIVLSPLLLLLAFLVKLTSRGPVLYKQERVSVDGTRFRIYKFRSMHIDAESHGPGWTKPKDSRVTWFGSILRRTSLDELPQLFNVLRGDMSVVGPRPERPVYVEQFRNKIPLYMLRHKVPAGITGWAQIHGWRGDTSIDKRIEYDLDYIENWSFFLDLKILLITLFRGFKNKNAY